MTNSTKALHDDIIQIREEYIKNRYVFVSGKTMSGIIKNLGASDYDIKNLKRVSENLAEDPTLPFRESRNGRFCYDFDRNELLRLEYQPFVLSAEEDFVRHDSGQVRAFRGVEDELQLNTAFQALMFFKSYILKGMDIKKRPGLDYSSNKWVSTVFNLRTITTRDILGEPALEGVHSDGVDHTMTTYLGSVNTTSDSAITYIHDMLEKNAIRFNETNPNLIRDSYQHTNFLDTVLIVDHENKHSLSPVYANDIRQRATRDMLIFFTRKPVLRDHKSFPYDSLSPHQEIPLEVKLPDQLCT